MSDFENFALMVGYVVILTICYFALRFVWALIKDGYKHLVCRKRGHLPANTTPLIEGVISYIETGSTEGASYTYCTRCGRTLTDNDRIDPKYYNTKDQNETPPD